MTLDYLKGIQNYQLVQTDPLTKKTVDRLSTASKSGTTTHRITTRRRCKIAENSFNSVRGPPGLIFKQKELEHLRLSGTPRAIALISPFGQAKIVSRRWRNNKGFLKLTEFLRLVILRVVSEPPTDPINLNSK